MTDLAHFDDLIEGQDRGAELVIRHPVTGDAVPDVVMIVVGPDSETYRRSKLQMQDALLAFSGKPPAREYDQLDIERLARCIVGWRVTRDGKTVDFSFTNVVRLLTSFAFMRDQIEAFSQSRVEYFKRTPLIDEVSA